MADARTDADSAFSVAAAIVDRLLPGMVEREPETICTWIAEAITAHAARQLAATRTERDRALERLVTFDQMKAENAMLRTDNERLTRAVNAHDWEAKIIEAVEAGQRLLAENAALRERLAKLETEHTAWLLLQSLLPIAHTGYATVDFEKAVEIGRAREAHQRAVVAVDAPAPAIETRPCMHRIGQTTCGYPANAPMHLGAEGVSPPAGRHEYTPVLAPAAEVTK